jgi:two-component system, OmpR family, copper resistance phosphate regulon response regulator CusR
VRILLAEDDPNLAAAVQQGLQGEGFVVRVVESGEEAFYLAQTKSFELLILDIMLPGRDGIEVLRDLRQLGLSAPVLLLTARDSVDDRVRGLDAGADDYLSKPFAFAELLARVRALSRRATPQPAAVLKTGDLELDPKHHRAVRGGQDLGLTAKEFELLEYFLRHAGEVVSREMLATAVWQEPLRHTAIDNVIDVQIGRLRRKLDEPFGSRLLHTIRGVGFVLREET